MRIYFISTLFLLYSFSFKAQTILLKKGETAPDFPAIDLRTNTEKKLSTISTEYCLIIFYHKAQDILNLKTLYDRYKLKGLEIYAVSACDNCELELTKIKDYQMKWVTVRQCCGIPVNQEKYYNKKTNVSLPFYYLLDKNKISLTERIISYGKLEGEVKKYIK